MSPRGFISTEAEIWAAKNSGGWTKERLASWGVTWPPPKGWKEALIAAPRIQQRLRAREEAARLERLAKSDPEGVAA